MTNLRVFYINGFPAAEGPLFIVGRGTGPRQRPRNPTIAGDRPPRYDEKKRLPLIVGLGPSDATRASERVSLASVRATEKRLLFSSGP